MSDLFADEKIEITRTIHRSRKGTKNTMTEEVTRVGVLGSGGTIGTITNTIYEVSDGSTQPPTVEKIGDPVNAHGAFRMLEERTPAPGMEPQISAHKNAPQPNSKSGTGDT